MWRITNLLMLGFLVLRGGTAMAFIMTTSAFDNNGTIPKQQTCDGEDLSPTLKWSDAPAGTKSFVMMMDDPDAPPGTWVHWVIYDIPADAKGLEEGLPKKETLTNGAKHGLCWGVNDFSRVGYYGPCPPPGKPHRYSFRLYALDAKLDLPPRATKFQLEAKMKGHILGQTELIGQYGR